MICNVDHEAVISTDFFFHKNFIIEDRLGLGYLLIWVTSVNYMHSNHVCRQQHVILRAADGNCSEFYGSNASVVEKRDPSSEMVRCCADDVCRVLVAIAYYEHYHTRTTSHQPTLVLNI